jgi:hypothetical protein
VCVNAAVIVCMCSGCVIIADCQQRTFCVFAVDGQLRHNVAVEPWTTVRTSVFNVVGVTENSYAVGEMDENRVLQLSLLHPDATSASGNWKVGYKTAHNSFFNLFCRREI